ncbi:TOPRIM nucleotidyl transferase/hydrolase domain-containing protein [Peribacillus sp. NPDC097225]|uniref:TOPRIM nucleotidyl transferase/hydrolase domain-containing protein n=1 Tax=Peribacillus sp. NPDC097225 TaxID=3364400 RepID=UPI0037FC83F5
MFFANHNLLVEGETEYSVVMSLLNDGRVDSSIHVLNCLGKGNIVTVSKILNHFSVPYSILHDSDNPTTMRQGIKIRNSAWTNNEKINEEVEIGREKGINIKTFVSIPDFEGEFLEGVKGSSKPFEAWKYFKEDNVNTERFIKLLNYIIDDSVLSCPNEYTEITQIITRVEQHIIDKDLHEHELWDIEYFYANR